MLSKRHVLDALDLRGNAFEAYEQTTGTGLVAYGDALRWYEQQSRQHLDAMLASTARPGALPTGERVADRGILHAGPAPWDNHRQAREWARDTLAGVTTVAVDGSQIAPDPRYSIPVGAVQAGWFINPHDASERYIKDIRFEVLPPDDLSAPKDADTARTGGSDTVGGFSDQLVSLRRFELECQVLVEQMRRLADAGDTAVCFLDGSLTLSFAAGMRPTLKSRYLRAVQRLLEISRNTRVPLVGFIDTTRATDMAAMLRALQPGLPDAGLSDGQILRAGMRWGDRTELLTCARDDGLFNLREGDRTVPGFTGQPADDYYRDLAFTYVKTTARNAPARVEMPRWMVDDGVVDPVLDVLRAECVVGTGYPYAIETADAVAVITGPDRQAFFQAFEQFLGERGISLRFSTKANSKLGRR